MPLQQLTALKIMPRLRSIAVYFARLLDHRARRARYPLESLQLLEGVALHTVPSVCHRFLLSIVERPTLLSSTPTNK